MRWIQKNRHSVVGKQIQIFVVTVILNVYVLLLPKTQFVNIHLLSGKKYIQNLRRVTSEVLQTKRFVHRHC